jgi:spore maturation protein SpmA
VILLHSGEAKWIKVTDQKLSEAIRVKGKHFVALFIGLMSIMGVWWGLKRHLIGESILHHPAGFRP